MNEIRHFTEDKFKLFFTHIGKVVSNNDPKKRDRVRVRINGITSDDVLDSNCPWAEQEAPLFASDSVNPGTSSAPKVGTLVYVKFLMGDPSKPIYTGIVRGASDSSDLHNVTNLSNTVAQTRQDNLLGPELPPLNSSSVYPDNNVIETPSGNVLEMDDTEGNERITLAHNTGAHFEIRPDGTIQIKSMQAFLEIITAAVNKEWGGGATITSSATTHIGDLIVTGDVIVSGIVTATDCISDTISGKTHTHTGDSGGTTSPPL